MGQGMQKAVALLLVGALVLSAAVVALSSDLGPIALIVIAVLGGGIGWALFRKPSSQD